MLSDGTLASRFYGNTREQRCFVQIGHGWAVSKPFGKTVDFRGTLERRNNDDAVQFAADKYDDTDVSHNHLPSGGVRSETTGPR